MKQLKLSLIFLIFFLFSLNTTFGNNPFTGKSLKNKTCNRTMPGNWLQDFAHWLTTPLRPEYGEYTVNGQNNNYPLVMFKRSTFNTDKQKIIDQIKITGSDFNRIYFYIFYSATNTNTYTIPSFSYGDDYRQTNPLAAFAKNAAFVALLGVDASGNALDPTYIDILKNNANTALTWGNTTMDIFKAFKGLPDDDWGDVQYWRSIELMDYLITYDLLRTTGYTFGSTEWDNPAIYLKKFTTFLYEYADRPLNTLSHFLNNNLTIITGSALVMASVVLHDQTDYFYRPESHPKTWAKKGHCRIRESEFTSFTHSQSKKGGVYGHEEGPGYYAAEMKYGVIPMATAFFNFTNENKNFSKIMIEDRNLIKIIIELFGQEQKISNYFYDPDWQNTFVWYRSIIQPNGSPVSYNDTRIDAGLPTLACTKDPQYSFLWSIPLRNSFNLTYDDRADFLAANNVANPSQMREVNVVNKESNEAIFRTPVPSNINEEHFIHINAQNPGGLQELREWMVGYKDHLHPSGGNITICAGNEILLLDPPYDLYGNRNQICLGSDHNVVTVSGQGPVLSDDPKIVSYNIKSKEVKIFTEYEDCDPDAEITRTVRVHDWLENGHTRFYYEVIDECKVAPVFGYQMEGKTFKLNLNGNGLISPINTTYTTSTCDNSRLEQGIVVWSHPCDARGTWKLYAHTTVTTPGISPTYNLADGYVHGTDNFSDIPFTTNPPHNRNSIACDKNATATARYGTHARFTTSFYAEKGTFHTFLVPLKCSETSLLKSFAKNDSTYSLSTILNLGADSISNIHLARGPRCLDTIVVENALFNTDTSYHSIIKLKGEHGFFSISKDSTFIVKSCVSYTKFRKANISTGNFLGLNDTVYIKSDTIACDADYKLVGRYRYRGTIQTDTECTVQFYLPDIDMASGMLTKSETDKELKWFSYDFTSKVMKIRVDTGLTEFFIEPTDPCYAPCFFPPTTTNIKDTFDFFEGTIEHLAHKLTILPDTGWLMMSNGSKTVICPNYMLINKDSITMVGLDPSATGHSDDDISNDLPPNTDSGAKPGLMNVYATKRTMIVIMDKASLILDSGSHTYVGVNSTILVQKGGTLYVRRGATLEIGSGHMNSWPYYGEIIAEDSSFVCIEDSSDIHFYINHNDSSDKNLFFISFSETKPAIAGVNPSGILGKFNQYDNDGNPGLYYPHNCLNFCELKTKMPPDGINNKIFGWCNVNRPHVEFKTKPFYCVSDEADTPYIYNTEPSLNEVKYRIEVMTGDTLISTATKSAYLESGLDTLRLKPVHCLGFYGTYTPGTYFVRVIVENSCGEKDTASSFFSVIKSDIPAFRFTDTNNCPGFGSITAIDTTQFDSTGGLTKYWHVHLIDTTQFQENDTNNNYYGGDWQVPLTTDTFRFDSLNWLGGFKYAVSLTYRSYCNEITTWDTISVEPGAYIFASPATIYSDPLGPASLKLNAYIGQATSFTWSPTTYLDHPDSLNPIATPTDTVTYILTSTKGSCHAYDTLFVSHNKLAFAGKDSTVCTGSSVLTGPDYDATLLLAILKFQGGGDFQTLHDIYYNNDAHFFDGLSLFMISEAGKNDMNASGCSQLIDFYSNFDRALFYKKDWFVDFYNMYVGQSSHADAFDYFSNQVHDDHDLSDYLDMHPIWDDFSCINNMFIDYNNYLQNPALVLTSNWDVYTNGNWVSLTDWSNYLKTTQTINTTSTFKLTVIDNEHGRVEYDQVTYTADTILQPMFELLFQTDSTIYFSNTTLPVSSNNTFSWNFGDGGTSTQLSPIHTFAAFDSSYIVCLSATNMCGVQTWCDTVRVDSSGILDHLSIRRNQTGVVNNNQNNQHAEQAQLNMQKNLGVDCHTYPNPFDDRIMFVYKVNAVYTKGQLQVFNALGQQTACYLINGEKGFVNIQTDTYAKGVYYYQLNIDGAMVKTGKLVKE